MTNLTPEERAIRKQSIENISEIYVPISVIEQIKAEIEYKANQFNQRPEISYDTAYSDGLDGALSILDKHIKEYTE